MGIEREILFNDVLFALGLTVFAGLATGIGSLIAFLTKRTNKKFLSVALGFSAGVMIYVSMIEIFGKARDAFQEATKDEVLSNWYAIIAFFGGMFVIALIDKLVPSHENPHEFHDHELPEGQNGNSEVEKKAEYKKLYRTGVVVAMAIAIHNFPEGLATFIAALHDPKIALPIAAAIAIHNIPEGISVSVPVYYATGSKKKAFIYSFLSGLAEPVGALIGFVILRQFMTGNVMSHYVFGFTFAAVAGIMVFISIDELLPAAREYGEHHLSIYGLVLGMIVMAVSLVLFM
ncbi:MAG: zinc transporter ZupT [bacterium]|nr:zinc transporter ZupT [bacterium]